MDLKDYFAQLCRDTAVKLNIEPPSIKKLTGARNKNQQYGTGAFLSFDGFKILVSYIETGKTAYAQQTIWVSVSLDCDTSIPFSLYDILAILEPENFNCYTYTYVDSEDLMKQCFDELTTLFARIAPLLSELLEDGVTKNKIIAAQKDSIDKYFGDSIFESGEMLGGAADKLISMMLQNFYEAQIEAAVVGTQSYFYSGNHKKTLKKLKKSKHKTTYQKNLQKHLENGGTSENISKIAKEASAEKGVLRHGGGVKASLKLVGLSFLFTIPVSVLFALIYTGICAVLFRESVFTAGYFENLLIAPFFCFILGVAIAVNFTKHKQENKKHTDKTSVHTPKAPKAVNEVLKYFTIAAESLALIGCLTCVFSTTPFFENYFKYSQEDFPLNQSVCEYKSIDFIGVIDGFYDEKGNFYEEKYVVVKTISGQTIDLYNSTWLSADIILKSKDFFVEKGIQIKQFKTFEEYKSSI